jgi:drug/metabolite transporter (DMT)-like permease
VNDASRGALFLVVSAVSFGLLPIFAKLAYQQGLTVDGLLFLRFLLAFLIMGCLLFVTRKLTIPARKDLALLLALGAVAYFLQSSFYFTAIVYSPVAVVALILYTYPALVTAGSYALGWEKVSRRLLAGLGVALVGLVLVANPTGGPVGGGAVLAFLASVAYTIYILTGTGVLRRVRGEIASFYVMGAACVSFGLTVLVAGPSSLSFRPLGWVWILCVAVVCTVIAATTFFLGLSLIGPSRSSLISLLEPITAASFAFLVFGQGLGPLQALGGLLILASALLTVALRERKTP